MKSQPTDLAPLFGAILEFQPSPQDLRRAKIFSSVIELISQKGIDQVTFESVGKKAKMARSHVAYYFKNREQLIFDTLQFVTAFAQRFIAERLKEEDSSWKNLLKATIDANFAWVKKHPDHAAVMALLYYQSYWSKSSRKLHTEIRDIGRKRLEAILKLRSSRQSPAKIRKAARGIQALMTGNITDALATNNKDFARIQQETVEIALAMAQSA